MTGYATLDRPKRQLQRRAVSHAGCAVDDGYTVLVGAREEQKASLVAAGLSAIGRVRIRHVEDASTVVPDLARIEVDAALIVVDSPDPHVVATLRAIAAVRPLPVVLFVARGSRTEIDEAIAAGATALVIDGLEESRIASVLQVALCRFKADEALRAALAQAKSDLAARKIIERAKGILMERRKLNEADAYAMLRRSAMQDGKTIAEIAEAIMAADRLLAM